MNSGDLTYERFRTTRWTEIRGLAGGAEAERQRAMEVLAARYWPPVYAALRARGQPFDRAADLTQEFFAQVVLHRGLFERADEQRGKLRSYLLTCLDRFVIDQHRRRTARGDDKLIPLDSIRAEEERWSDAQPENAPSTFDQRWALAVLDESLERCESHFRGSNRERHWSLFDGWVLASATGQPTPGGFAQCARAAGFDSTAQATSALQVVKERMKALLREVVGETVEDGADIDAELAEVERLLAVH